MAELGAIASVVQLVDVALRVSAEVCSFLDAYKDTARDVKSLRDILRDVEANVRNLRRYILRFKKSTSAIDEFEVLSEAVIGAFQGLNDLRILQDTQNVFGKQAKNCNTLDSISQKQDQNHTQLLSQADVVSTNVGNLHKSSIYP
ncbi:hypothetical protein PTT_06901 [Pyrenophora teres f. teres 0-1]|uniref:Uncharacterized protein n=1 Tax=Pyrenophora teres f. teres (strain 0-1) TaxID=861557 RepID=E3RGG8_PYRTT|nr:hypothetical protein PTT_06901 [Pyrenophora teres f. teres 0-1]